MFVPRDITLSRLIHQSVRPPYRGTREEEEDGEKYLRDEPLLLSLSLSLAS